MKALQYVSRRLGVEKRWSNENYEQARKVLSDIEVATVKEYLYDSDSCITLTTLPTPVIP